MEEYEKDPWRPLRHGRPRAGSLVAGNPIECNRNETVTVTGDSVKIRLDNGTTKTLERTETAGLHAGDRIHLDSSTFSRV